MNAQPCLTFHAIKCVGVLVPMSRPLATSAQTVTHAPLLLVDLLTEEGVTGHSYLFCYTPSAVKAVEQVVDDISKRLKGMKVEPLEINTFLHQSFRLLGVRGLVSMAIAGVDVACWDALAQAKQMPLTTLLGGSPKAIKAYNSCGLGLMAPEAAADEAIELLENGFKALKLRLGRENASADLMAIRAVRKKLPDHIELMVDFNQALSLPEAIRRCKMIDDEGLAWIEEPIRHDDYDGYAQLSRSSKTPMQFGENFTGCFAMSQAIKSQSSHLMMPDLERIGGVTGWLKAAALSAAAGIEISSHLFPEVSAHLLAVSPTAHWLEYVDWANPILKEPMNIADGHSLPRDVPGTGIEWDEHAVAKFKF